MKLRTKFGLLFIAVFAVLTIVLSLQQAWWVQQLVVDQTADRMKQNIRSAWQILDSHRRHLETVTTLLAEEESLKEYERRTAEELMPELQRHCSQWRLDVLVLLQRDSTVFARARSESRGDVFRPKGLSEVFASNSPASGYFLLPADQVRLESDRFQDQCLIGSELGEAMVSFAVVPIRSQNGRLAGRLLAGTLLNNANSLVDDIRQTIFSEEIYQEKPVGTATIFRGPVRIATTVLVESGNRAVGTLVSEEVHAQVLGKGVPWTGPATVVNDRYLSRYDPIRDPSGRVIGMLYIGELEQIYRDLESQTVLSNLSVVLAVMIFSFAVSYLIGQGMLRQISALDLATQRFAAGDMSARVEVHSRDEIGDLAASFNAMAQEIAEDREQIIAQKSEIEGANRNYLDMLGFVTHELRSSISAALFNVELLKDESFGPLEGDLREGVGVVERSLRYMLEVTQNYLQLSRIEKGELIPVKRHVHVVRDVIQPVLDEWGAQARDRDMHIDVAIPDEQIIRADANLLRIVYDNLVGNAIKYGRQGGRILLDSKPITNGVELGVQNEGKAIPPDVLPRLFDKFERYDVDESTGRKGTGLGLFIVKQIVSRHGGAIHVTSNAETGTRFAIALNDDTRL
ncbi:MAG: hypothetical protein AMXMBFR84_29790 [Candidatus Hydrogenedentota bacterium]